MKNYIRILTMIIALTFGAVSGAWAQLITSDEIKVKPNASAGTVTIADVTTRVVTLTVTPDAAYFIRKSDFIIEKLISPDNANAPKRRVGEVTDVIKGKMYNSEMTEEITSVKGGSSAKYIFTIPDGYDGVYVTATFHLQEEGDTIRITASTNLGNNPDMTKHYILVEDVDAEVVKKFNSSTAFTGTFEGEAQADGSFPTISGLTHALFQTIDGGTVKNIMFDNVNISGGTNVGTVCNEAIGDTRIYNCGVLATGSTANTDEDGYTYLTACSSTVSGSNYVGSIVGLLDGESRVINCFSYANVSGGSYVGGIVGYNNVATTATATATNLKTMVMNCMFYGEVSGSSIAPIYNGEIITNVGQNTGVSNFNYFRLESSYIEDTNIAKVYNCALGAETRFLQRFEFFRNLQNSHRELAAWWATGDRTKKNDIAKWVLLPSQIGSSTPYPVLKAPGYYPSVVNIDAKNATHATERNKGGRMGTLSVTIQPGNGEVYNAPTEAHIRIPFKTLIITDKDPEHFNFNYYKVQLPYYNEVGTGNYTGNRVVTGWKIVSITGGTPGTFSTSTADAPSFNFADRNCTNKDLYSTSHRVFNQGAYWDVPEGVTAITIEPYWAKCVYLADPNADKVYTQDMKTGYNVPNVGGGQIYTNGNSYSIAGENQIVYTTMGNAIASSGSALFAGVDANTHTVNDYAVVLVGNYHHYGALEASNSKPYTVTSIDLDGDNEPDYSYILRFDGRTAAHPVKVDFINIPGLGMAQKSTGGTGSYNFGIMQPKGWFESTNTSLFRVTQFEYDRSDRGAAPYIVQGGVIEQWVSGQNNGAANNTTYFHVGGNAWFKEFHRGTHQDKNLQSKHPPVSVTGGDYDEFYLTGLYTANVTSYGDNAECYINGGRFGTVAGAAMEGLGKAKGADDTGNITWQIQNADIKEFYGGGINAAKPVTGNISTTITGGKIDLFCGGPKFGDMSTGKTVTTHATNCIFGTFFGAGYGGNSYSRQAPRNHNNLINFPHNDKDAGNDASWNAWLGRFYTQSYSSTYGGVSTQFNYQFLPMSGNADNVARIFVEFVKFSLATCRNVTSTLTGCKITGNFYGGGSLGKVDGPVTSALTNCEVQGSAFGAGFSASLPSVEVDSVGFRTEPYYYTDLGTYRTGVKGKTTTYNWAHGNAISIDTDKKILYTTENLDGLGAVTGTVTLTINGTTTVAESVYGGGEESGVDGNTRVTVNGGFIGEEGRNSYGYKYGNVYGGGKGKISNKDSLVVSSVSDLDAGLVKGNTTVIINGTPETTKIVHNVYGGGAVGSVGTFTRDVTGMPTDCTANTGLATVTINGGIIGHDHKDTGMVNGSSRGWEGDPRGEGAFAFLNQLAWVNNANVTIGNVSTDPQEDAGPTIYGSVYGGGENGHNLGNGAITVYKGTIGYEPGTWDCGNLYGAGCGTDTFWRDDNGNGEVDEGEDKHRNPMAGIVCDSTFVTIKGGHVIRNVYGAGSMGSVGKYTYDENGLPTTCAPKTGNTIINIRGGVIGKEGTDYGHVFGGPKGSLTETEFSASVRETLVNIDSVANVKGSVFGGGEAGIVRGSVVVNMNGGEVAMDVYGGGALANTNTDVLSGSSASTITTTINLKGGKVNRNVYGGALGQTADAESGLEDVEAKVYGNVLVELNKDVPNTAKGCVVPGSIFGCNNLNGTPKGDVKVHIYKTQNDAASCIANAPAGDETPAVTDAKEEGRYDVTSVYGGGNQSAYVPANLTGNKTEVVIDGCKLTSIRQVYGGGNAACTPATNVTVNGTFEINELFGGGNGLDNILINGVEMPNPGANVGYKNYSEYYKEDDTWKVRDKAAYDTKEERRAATDPVTGIVYGTGKASVNIYGGTIHSVFGGSNTKGNVRQTAVTLLDDKDDCQFVVDEAYGGGKSAEMDAEAQLLMACIPGLKAVYGGAEAADVHGNVTLNITNGTFDRVFGGNNVSGTIGGSITINVMEIGCKPVKIGQLYGGGNLAGYSVYGYDSDGKPRETGTRLYDDPQVNVMSFTSIGNIYGGGYGGGATMVGNPTVNVNEAYGKYYNNDLSVVGEDEETPNHYPIPSHAKGKMGAINNVFGGGNEAKVIGNTTVNIATLEYVYIVKKVAVDDDVSDYYIRKEDGSYEEASKTSSTALDGVTYYEKTAVLGADIRGNIYGGGNNAEVTGNANVQIGKKEE